MNSEIAVQMHMALDAKIGVELSVSDIDAFKRHFYAIRAEARNEGFLGFDNLTLRTCPTEPSKKIWIVRKDHGAGEAGSSESHT